MHGESLAHEGLLARTVKLSVSRSGGASGRLRGSLSSPLVVSGVDARRRVRGCHRACCDALTHPHHCFLGYEHFGIGAGDMIVAAEADGARRKAGEIGFTRGTPMRPASAGSTHSDDRNEAE